MISFSDTHIYIANHLDIAVIAALLNRSYRGESSKKGWTTEAYLIGGDTRTDADNLLKIMSLPTSVFLKYTGEDGNICGCVNLQELEEKLYLGMFSVDPELQGKGIGKRILIAAEEYARQVNLHCIYMSVITVRAELISWYKRHGYIDTGKRMPFKEDGLTGKHLQPLEFMILEKYIEWVDDEVGQLHQT